MLMDRSAVAERERGGWGAEVRERSGTACVKQRERERESMFEGKDGEKVLARGDENVKKQTQLIHLSHVLLFHVPKSLYSSINT